MIELRELEKGEYFSIENSNPYYLYRVKALSDGDVVEIEHVAFLQQDRWHILRQATMHPANPYVNVTRRQIQIV